MPTVENKYEAKEVVCPFYRFERDHAIYCEGIYGCGVIQTFDKKDYKMRHKKMYCHGVDTCKLCRLYQAINVKYERRFGNG
jgi:hypothetical protein